ncbi:HRDC-like protein [Globomyces pollinis-pini]|nr:HRDC-like protein [Globomyces pollinis-pini]
MKMLNIQSASLTNYEVLSFLNEEATQEHLLKNPKFENFRTVNQYTKKFLMEPMMPCSVQDESQISAFLNAMLNWELTKMEKLQLINLRPVCLAELGPIIPEIQDRFTSEKQQELLDLINLLLPYERPLPEEEEEEEDN